MTLRPQHTPKPDLTTGYDAARLPGADVPWVIKARQAGKTAFEATGVPTPFNEEWTFTNLKPLAVVQFEDKITPANENTGSVSVPFVDVPGATKLVFVDGVFDAAASDNFDTLPVGVTLVTFARAVDETLPLVEKYLGKIGDGDSHAFQQLNTAWMRDGIVLHIDKDLVLDTPVIV